MKIVLIGSGPGLRSTVLFMCKHYFVSECISSSRIELFLSVFGNGQTSFGVFVEKLSIVVALIGPTPKS